MALARRTRDAIRNQWADRLGCTPAAFEETGVTLTTQSSETVRVLRRGDATVVAAPERVRAALTTHRNEVGNQPLSAVGESVRRALADQSGEVVDAPGEVVDLPDEVVDVHGPAVLSYVDATHLSPAASAARVLEDDDAAAFQRLRRRIPVPEWNRASPTFRPGRTAGLFREEELVAVATLGTSTFPDVGVVVHPEHRNSGYGRQTVSRVLTAAFERDAGTVPRYRTPERERASLSLAASLGFERWASETVVVLD